MRTRGWCYTERGIKVSVVHEGGQAVQRQRGDSRSNRSHIRTEAITDGKNREIIDSINDIALIRLTENIPDYQRIQLSSEKLDGVFARAGLCATVTGWGWTCMEGGDPVATSLQRADVPITDNARVQPSAYPGPVRRKTASSALATNRASVDSCQGRQRRSVGRASRHQQSLCAGRRGELGKELRLAWISGHLHPRLEVHRLDPVPHGALIDVLPVARDVHCTEVQRCGQCSLHPPGLPLLGPSRPGRQRSGALVGIAGPPHAQRPIERMQSPQLSGRYAREVPATSGSPIGWEARHPMCSRSSELLLAN